jgi:hypothetical protein
VHLVDGHVQVQVVGVEMHRRNALMIAQTDGRANLVLDLVQCLDWHPLARRQADDQVVMLVLLAPGVLRLGGEDLWRRPGRQSQWVTRNAPTFLPSPWLWVSKI